jgi:hypothetical protein
MIPSTDRGRAMIVALLMIGLGLAVALPPVALWGPGFGLVVPGALVLLLALLTPPDEVAP